MRLTCTDWVQSLTLATMFGAGKSIDPVKNISLHQYMTLLFIIIAGCLVYNQPTVEFVRSSNHTEHC
jgi:hypothetical protein